MIRRRGFTMITVLWTMSVASVVALAAALSGRNSVNAARNRVQSERAYWIATGCARQMQSAVDDLLRGAANSEQASSVWRTLDRQTRAAADALAPDCAFQLTAAGTLIDVNAASEEMLTSLWTAMGIGGDEGAALTDALFDWTDSDAVARPAGAESTWYAAAQRRLPSNAPLGDIRELGYVKGFEDLERFESVLSTEQGRVSLATAPATVLAAVPGFTTETAELVARLHDEGTPVSDLLDVAGQLSVDSRSALMARFSDIARLATVDPDAWVLTTRAANGLPPSTVTLVWRLGRTGSRCVVIRTTTAL